MGDSTLMFAAVDTEAVTVSIHDGDKVLRHEMTRAEAIEWVGDLTRELLAAHPRMAAYLESLEAEDKPVVAAAMEIVKDEERRRRQ